MQNIGLGVINIINLIVLILSFMMNGKGLCLMTMDMFTVRAPLGGKTLFKVMVLMLVSMVVVMVVMVVMLMIAVIWLIIALHKLNINSSTLHNGIVNNLSKT